MMIKSSLHLIFVLLYKFTYLRSELEKKKLGGRGVLYFFNELLIWPLIFVLLLCFFCQEIFLWSKKMGIILQLF